MPGVQNNLYLYAALVFSHSRVLHVLMKQVSSLIFLFRMFGEIAKCLRSRTHSDADPTVLAIMPSVERIVMNDDLRSTLSRDVSSASGRSSRLSRDLAEDKENTRPIESMSMKELQAKIEKGSSH